MADLGPVAWSPEPIKTERLVLREPGAPERHPGLFIVDFDGAMIGQVILKRAIGQAAGKAEIGYLLLPQAWGFGYAAEARSAALGWLAGELPGEPVVLKTQRPPARCASPRSWDAPRQSSSRHGAPSSGAACGPRSRRPIE